jgi:hypothetical protein
MKFEMKGSVWEVATMTLAVLGLILVILNAGLVMRNQSIQVTATGRQQVINQGLQYARIRQAVAQELANVAASKNDRDIIDLLAKHGINVTSNAGVAPAAPQGK